MKIERAAAARPECWLSRKSLFSCRLINFENVRERDGIPLQSSNRKEYLFDLFSLLCSESERFNWSNLGANAIQLRCGTMPVCRELSRASLLIYAARAPLMMSIKCKCSIINVIISFSHSRNSSSKKSERARKRICESRSCRTRGKEMTKAFNNVITCKFFHSLITTQFFPSLSHTQAVSAWGEAMSTCVIFLNFQIFFSAK